MLSRLSYARAHPDTFMVPFGNILLNPPFPYDAKKYQDNYTEDDSN